jgi:hypothetical protein
MNSLLPQCPNCRSPLGQSHFNQRDLIPCPACAAPLEAELFPAFFRHITPGLDGESILVEGESSCFYHPQKKAAAPCDGCGRFLCALCDCKLHEQHFCPACLEVGRKKGKIRDLENERTLYDSIALALALYPVIFIIGIYFTFITAPLALFFAIRYWRAPLSIVRRTKLRYIAAAILALLEILTWVLVILGVFNG